MEATVIWDGPAAGSWLTVVTELPREGGFQTAGSAFPPSHWPYGSYRLTVLNVQEVYSSGAMAAGQQTEEDQRCTLL